MSQFFQLLSWPTFGIALLVFGFAPGALLRVIVLAFPPGDPRRRELLAEVYAVPRAERPFWVAQQLEVALFEGLVGRLAALRAARQLPPAGYTKVKGFLVPHDTRLVVTGTSLCVASRHMDLDAAYIPLRLALARPVLDQLVSDPRFTELPRRWRKMVLNLLANGPEDPMPPRHRAFWDRVESLPCSVCGGGDCYKPELLVQELLPGQPPDLH